jgi:hypothetical protein
MRIVERPLRARTELDGRQLGADLTAAAFRSTPWPEWLAVCLSWAIGLPGYVLGLRLREAVQRE